MTATTAHSRLSATDQHLIRRLQFNIETQRVLIDKSASGSLEREAASQAYAVMGDALAALRSLAA